MRKEHPKPERAPVINTFARQASIEQVILDPKYRDVLAIVKGARNGAVYGAKVRFPHALVYVFGPNPSIQR